MTGKAVGYILSMDDEMIGTLKAEDVAANLNKNLKLFSLVFMIVQKITISNFILREKLHRAYYILERDHDISILKLSEKLGFNEAEIFEEEFEKYYAIKPILFQEYKERNRDFDKTLYKPPQNIFEKLRDIV